MVTRQNAEMAFCRLRIRANIKCETVGARHQPRLHDLRHNSECRIIPSGGLEGAANVEGFVGYCSA
jgi:hypothetical protein